MAAATQILIWMTTAHIVACLVLLWRDGRDERYAPYLAAFLGSVACYLHSAGLVAEPPPHAPWVHVVVAGRGALTPIYWLLGQALFDDDFRLRPVHALAFIGQMAAHELAFLAVDGVVFLPWLGPLNRKLFVALAVVGASAFVADVMQRVLRQADDDLVESRLRLRYVYLRVTAGYIMLAIVVNGASFALGAFQIWPLLDAMAIYGLVLGFSVTQMRLDLGKAANRVAPEIPDGLEARLRELMEKEQFFRTAGLTIGRLAERLGQPEHKLRALINSQWGFKNFSAFLNTLRIREAERALRDPTQDHLTVSEIAFALGYQSLGPFNRAFKELKGQTPTEFRKQL
jgi:AraC-like DNA-binding protein